MSLAFQKIAIFASGNGTNAENLIQYFKQKKNIEVALVVCNKAKAKVLLRAKKYNVPSLVIDNSNLLNSNQLIEQLNFFEINWIVLAGFLKKIPIDLINDFPNKIVNIHPSLLPKYGGKGMYGMKVHQSVKANNETHSGISIHLVNEIYDEGPIVFQAKCALSNTDTAEIIAQKVHQLEYEHFPKEIEKLILKA